jgi:hypothetical protein
MAKLKKISDKEFFAVLRENAGLYARTAKAIEEQFRVAYTRQAVRDRAEKHPDILADIEDENIDVAEAGLHSLMSADDDRVKLKAIELYLKTKGKKRGYVEKQEVESSGVQIIQVEYVNERESDNQT